MNSNSSQHITLFGEFSSFQKRFRSREDANEFIEKFNKLLNEEWFDWSFLYEWYPDYYHSYTIAINDDLAHYAIDVCSSNDGNDEQLAKGVEREFNIKGTGKEEKLLCAKELLNRFNKELYAEAIDNYIASNNEWPTHNYHKT